MIGPFRGGRVDAVSGVPGRPHEFYFGHVNGGVWKTINAGRTWAPVFDGQPVASIGALAVAPSNPDIVYVGTGESTLRDSNGYGNGVYKSTDAGRTWTHLGLDRTHHIGRIAIDPTNANVAFVAAIGDVYAATPDRGVFRTTDGGTTWHKALFVNENVGAVDVVIDATNPKVVYASLWATRRAPWFTYAPSNSPGGGLYKSSDGGTTWKRLTAGLPTEQFGRSGLAIAPSNSRRVYAVIDAVDGGLFRSDDAGATWTKTTGDTRVWGRGWYFEKVVVDPTNPDIVFVPNVGIQKSKDGGKTFLTFAVRGSPGGDDYHQLWISPTDPNVMIVASDQGSVISLNGTADTPEWSSWYNQPTAQLYHVSVTHGFPWIATGAQQDSGAVWVRFARLHGHDLPAGLAGGVRGRREWLHGRRPAQPGRAVWQHGREVQPVAEREHRRHHAAGGAGQGARRLDPAVGLLESRSPRALLRQPVRLQDRRRRCALGPDLRRPDPARPRCARALDPATAAMTDRNGKRGVVYTLAPSPVLKPLIWAGTDDGLIHVSMTDGKSWQDVTPSAVGPWSRVTMIEASHTDFHEAYAAVDRHQLDDFAPHLYRTRDLGQSWQDISRGLPGDGYVHTIKEDPARRGLLVAGTERGVFLSFNSGDSWQSLQLNLPTTSMRDMEFHDHDLVLATHGRGFWVLDDISVLRQASSSTAQAAALLFKPAEAIAVVQGDDNGTPFQKDEPQAENAPVGAVIDYYLGAGATGSVTIDVLDDAGRVVRSVTSAGQAAAPPGPQTVTSLWVNPPSPPSAAPGQHRWVWDLRGTPPATQGGGDGGGFGTRPMVTGSFTVRLTAGSRTWTQPLVVRPDPRTR